MKNATTFWNALKKAVDPISYEILKNPKATTAQRLSIILCELGVRPHMVGYYYLKEAILMRINSSPDISFSIIHYYDEISAQYNTTSSRVERAIRHSIKTSANKTSLFDFIFNKSLKMKGEKPVNKYYIEQVALYYNLLFS